MESVKIVKAGEKRQVIKKNPRYPKKRRGRRHVEGGRKEWREKRNKGAVLSAGETWREGERGE